MQLCDKLILSHSAYGLELQSTHLVIKNAFISRLHNRVIYDIECEVLYLALDVPTHREPNQVLRTEIHTTFYAIEGLKVRSFRTL